MTTLTDVLAGQSGKFHKWNAPGDTLTGVITGVELRQATEFGSDKPATWDNGDKKWQVIVRLATDLRVDGDDDGARALALNAWGGQKRALVAACAAAGVDEPKPGQRFTAQWVDGDGTAQSPRNFTYLLENVTGVAAALTSSTPPAPTVAAPVVAAAAAPPAVDPVATAKQLSAAGVDAATIAGLVGLPQSVVEALTAAPQF